MKQLLFKAFILVISLINPFTQKVIAADSHSPLKKDTLIFKGDSDFPPYEFLNEKGEPDGFTIELIHAIMAELEIPYRIELNTWHNVYQEFLQGKVDVITSLAHTKRRESLFVYGPIHSYTHPNAITYKNSLPIRKKKELINRTIIVQNSDLYHDILAEEKEVKTINVEKVSDALRLLPTTKDGIVLCDDKMARSIIYRYGIKDLIFSDINLPQIPNCFAGKDEEIMNRISYGFAIVKKEGIYKELSNKWLENNENKERVALFYGIAIALAIIAAILLLFVRLLKKQVNKNTEEIVKQVHQIENILLFGDIYLWEYNLKTDKITIFSGTHEVKERISSEEYLTRLLPQDKEILTHKITSLKEAKESTVKVEQAYVHPTGKIKYYMIHGTAHTNEEKKVISYAGMIRDVTELKEIQFRLNSEKEKAEQSDKLKSAFLANMSHEIRTPLNAIIGFSNLLQYSESPEERELFINIINTNNNLLLQLIDDILDLSKIEAGTVEMSYRHFNLKELFNQFATSIQPRFEDKKELKLILDYPQDEYSVNLDSNRVIQLLNNLTSNALKNSSKGSITIGYRCSTEELHIWVTDTGIGISPENQERIFERFEKVNSFVQGTGLGLAICKAIVEAMHGEIGVNSEEGKGSTFWVTLPYKKETK